MADRSTERRWLEQLTAIPTAPGREGRVMRWVRAWAGRRSGDLRVHADPWGNLLITQKGRRRRPPVVAVAHTDHPGFVVREANGREVAVEFRGGVRPEYFQDAGVELFDRDDSRYRGRLEEFEPGASAGVVSLSRRSRLEPGDIGRWTLGRGRGGVGERFALAPACDDLAGVAAALSALDRSRGDPARRHLAVLLTRAEEVGFLGAIGAARQGTLPPESRVLSIECSRAFPESPLGGGPVVRVGDASSVFDSALTNRISQAASASGLRHQRKLMAGGSCEATAFIAYGYEASGLCLPLGNYHNMGNLDQVEEGKGMATALPEVVSIDDFHGLVDLLGLATDAADGQWEMAERLDRRFQEQRHILE
ncbi:MAG: hypothetical protein ACLFWM_08580 [Actinomycetota bacterium]